MRLHDSRARKRRKPPMRRKTVRWSNREVEALLAGVRVHGVGKWAAILRHSPVFNGVRTSVDLKDKWRNLTSPVRAAVLSQAKAETHGKSSEMVEETSIAPSPIHRTPLLIEPATTEQHSSDLATAHQLLNPSSSPQTSHSHSPPRETSPSDSPPPPDTPTHLLATPPPMDIDVRPPSESSTISPDLLPQTPVPLAPSFSQPTPPLNHPNAPHPTPHLIHHHLQAYQQAVSRAAMYRSAATLTDYWTTMRHQQTLSFPHLSMPPYFPLSMLGSPEDEDDDEDDEDAPFLLNSMIPTFTVPYQFSPFPMPIPQKIPGQANPLQESQKQCNPSPAESRKHPPLQKEAQAHSPKVQPSLHQIESKESTQILPQQSAPHTTSVTSDVLSHSVPEKNEAFVDPEAKQASIKIQPRLDALNEEKGNEVAVSDDDQAGDNPPEEALSQPQDVVMVSTDSGYFTNHDRESVDIADNSDPPKDTAIMGMVPVWFYFKEDAGDNNAVNNEQDRKAFTRPDLS